MANAQSKILWHFAGSSRFASALVLTCLIATFAMPFHSRGGWLGIKVALIGFGMNLFAQWLDRQIEVRAWWHEPAQWARVSALLMLLGWAVSTVFGERIEVQVREGEQVQIPGNMLRVPTELELQEVHLQSDGAGVGLQVGFFQRGVQIASDSFWKNQRLRFGGMQIFQTDAHPTDVYAVSLAWRQGLGDLKETREKPLFVGSVVTGPGFEFKVLAIQAARKGAEAGAQILFREVGQKKGETFWIFEGLPSLDAVQRRRSHVHFRVLEVRPLYRARLAVTSDPGVVLVSLGAIGVVVALFWSAFYNEMLRRQSRRPKEGNP